VCVVVQLKFRKGKVDRIDNSGHAIVKDMFKKDTDLSLFVGNEVVAACGTTGKIVSSFGKSGKVRVDFGYMHSVRGGNAVVMRMKKAVSSKL
jgi:ribosomal protein L35AE/L33A